LDRPLFAVTAADRYRALQLLRAFPHAQATLPFGETLHYTDTRRDLAPDVIARELAEYLAAQGIGDAVVRAIGPSIEDAFIALMGSTDAAPKPAAA
jgi:hypothetical protein